MSPTITRRFSKSNWAFVPGPLDDSAPMSSLDLKQQVQYTPQEIATAILAYPGMKLVNGNHPRWWDWKARWSDEEDFVELNVTLMGWSDELWGGSEINANCSLESLVAIWKHLKAEHPGIWLHDPDCRMHTEASFLREQVSN
jgi:hypothetical protein